MATLEELEKNFTYTCTKMDEKIKKDPVLLCWVKFIIGEGDNALVIDTTDRSKNNYFLSLKNKKNGTGQANKFEISLAFVPAVINRVTNEVDVHFIDHKLQQAKISAMRNSEKIGTSTDRYEAPIATWECKLQYGYVSTGTYDFKTKEYTCLILDYTCEVSRNKIIYNISGISTLIDAVEKKQNFPATKGRPTDIVKEALSKNVSNYDIQIAEDTQGTDQETEIREYNNVNVYQYSTEVLKQARCTTDTASPDSTSGAIEDKDRSIYNYIINDATPKSIIIKKFAPKELAEKKAAFTFYHGFPRSKGANLIIDFNATMKGAYILNRLPIENKDNNINVDSTGNVKDTAAKNEIVPYGYDEVDALIESNTWAEKIQGSWKATATLIGLPCEAPIGTCVDIVPLIYGTEHKLSRGKYMILSSEDTVDSKGFITRLDLLRLGDTQGRKLEF